MHQHTVEQQKPGYCSYHVNTEHVNINIRFDQNQDETKPYSHYNTVYEIKLNGKS